MSCFFFHHHHHHFAGCNYTFISVRIQTATRSVRNGKVEQDSIRDYREINQVAHNCGILVQRFIANMQINIIIQMNWSKDICDNQRKQKKTHTQTPDRHEKKEKKQQSQRCKMRAKLQHLLPLLKPISLCLLDPTAAPPQHYTPIVE